MNNWKIAFWIVILSLIIVTAVSAYTILEQGITLTFIREGYQDTFDDLITISSLLTESNLSKTDLMNILQDSESVFEYSSDSITLERVQLVFYNDTLKQVIPQW